METGSKCLWSHTEAMRSRMESPVAGSILVRIESHPGRLLNGNSAPLKKKRGNTTKLTINWNPSRLSIQLPIARPKLLNKMIAVM